MGGHLGGSLWGVVGAHGAPMGKIYFTSDACTLFLSFFLKFLFMPHAYTLFLSCFLMFLFMPYACTLFLSCFRMFLFMPYACSYFLSFFLIECSVTLRWDVAPTVALVYIRFSVMGADTAAGAFPLRSGSTSNSACIPTPLTRAVLLHLCAVGVPSRMEKKRGVCEGMQGGLEPVAWHHLCRSQKAGQPALPAVRLAAGSLLAGKPSGSLCKQLQLLLQSSFCSRSLGKRGKPRGRAGTSAGGTWRQQSNQATATLSSSAWTTSQRKSCRCTRGRGPWRRLCGIVRAQRASWRCYTKQGFPSSACAGSGTLQYWPSREEWWRRQRLP